MGQKFVPELHDPNHRKTKGQKEQPGTADKAERPEDIIAKKEREAARHKSAKIDYMIEAKVNQALRWLR